MQDGSRTTLAFSLWLRRMRSALQKGTGMNVPCGDCTACCRASCFIRVNAHERRTLQHIPKEILFPAPMSTQGNMLMGYDPRGRCPMLKKNGCAIYRFRPETCRMFDCRILAASGLAPLEPRNPISQQAKTWQFAFPTSADRTDYEAVQRAAVFLQHHPAITGPIDAIRTSLFAVIIYRHFKENNRKRSYIGKREPTLTEGVVKDLEMYKSRLNKKTGDV